MRKTKRVIILALAGAMLSAGVLSGCKGQNSEQQSGQRSEAVVSEPGGSGTEGFKEEGLEAEGFEAENPEAEEGSIELHSDTGADIQAVEVQRTTAPMPEFEAVSDEVYVKTSDGSSVRIRSACDTSDDSNILTFAVTGTRLKRTGTSKSWTRIDYNGRSGYISTDYITTEAPAVPSSDDSSAADGQGSSGSSRAEDQVALDPSWKYAEFSKINSGAAVKYRSTASERKNITVCVNAGHGTKGGSSVKTQCHPDGTPKVTGGTTSAGAVSAVAVSGGMTFADGTPESKVTLSMALILKDKLLAAGYDVLMIRESDDVQLDNVARTVIANNASDCHIALHWDSTSSDKGAFYMSVPSAASYRAMEPVASHWQQHNALGESLVSGLRGAGVKIFSNGAMEMDLTQTSYSTVPSIDIELGDKASDHSNASLSKLADGLLAGIDQYFGIVR